jgi:hypothetical protein
VKQEVGMARREGPSIPGRFGFRKEGTKSFQEDFTVLIGLENKSALDTAYHDVMQDCGSV